MQHFAVFNAGIYSLLSGLLACLVSIGIKLAFNTEIVLDKSEEEASVTLKLALKVLFVCLAVLCNSLMWIFYSKGLHLSTNTLYTTALNKFSNFISSAFFGYLFFEEKLNISQWFLGIVILFIGIVILSDEQKNQDSTKEETTKNVHEPIKVE